MKTVVCTVVVVPVRESVSLASLPGFSPARKSSSSESVSLSLRPLSHKELFPRSLGTMSTSLSVSLKFPTPDKSDINSLSQFSDIDTRLNSGSHHR